MLWINWRLEHILVQEVKSPSWRYVASLYILGQGGQPPYGETVQISTTWNPIGRYTGEVVFSGYCEGSSPVEWLDEHRLVIHCAKAKDVQIKRAEFDGIKVEIK